MNADLFESLDARPKREQLADGAMLLRGFALPVQHDLIAALDHIAQQAPFRQMQTPGGHQMSVAMTNCGGFGWVTDHSGYRYAGVDPVSQKAWPPMPRESGKKREGAEKAAAAAAAGSPSPNGNGK